MCCGDLKGATSGKETPALAVQSVLRKMLVFGVVTLASFYRAKLYKQDIGQVKNQKNKKSHY